jgi:hypothetical protein
VDFSRIFLKPFGLCSRPRENSADTKSSFDVDADSPRITITHLRDSFGRLCNAIATVAATVTQLSYLLAQLSQLPGSASPRPKTRNEERCLDTPTDITAADSSSAKPTPDEPTHPIARKLERILQKCRRMIVVF